MASASSLASPPPPPPPSSSPLSPPSPPPLPAGASLPGAALSASAIANASAQDKDELRALRMKRSNGVRERLWEQYQKICFTECDPDVKGYWVCRQEAGLLAPLRCSAESTAMKACLQACGKDAPRFEAFKEAKLAEWAAVSAAKTAAAASAAQAQAQAQVVR